MVKGRRQHWNRVVAIVASVALVVGLMPLSMAAFTAEPALADEATTFPVTVKGGTANKATAKPGEEVTITANQPETGKVFVQWGSTSSDVSLNPLDETPAKFFMPDHGVEFTAFCRELVIDDIPSREYTGDSIKPEPLVYLDSVDLVTWDSKTYRYVNNEDVGTATVFVEFSDRPGSNSATFNITEADISTADIEVTDLVYGDKPDPTVVWESTAVTKTLEEEVDYTVTCSNANVGKATVTIEGTGNFEGTKESEEFNITERPLTITADSGTKVYDGNPLTKNTYSSKGLAEGDTISSVTVTGTITDAGTSDNVPSAVKIVNGEGKDVTANYEITYVKGTLEVTKAPLTVTAKDQEYVYNGETQGPGDMAYDDEAEIAEVVTVKGLQGDDELTSVTVDGQGQAVGTYPLEPKGAMIGKDGSLNGNYEISYVNGTLTIKAEPAEEYTVKFVNYDGTVLQSGKVAEGQVPKYEGATPTRPETAECTYEFAGWTPEIAKVTGDATYTAQFAEKAKKGVYEAVSGAGSSWTQGSSDPLVFTFKRTADDETTFGHFAGILVDGKAVPERDSSGRANWTAAKGSVVVSLQPAYLATLSEGSHTLTAQFDDDGGDGVTVSFTIPAKAQPAQNSAATPRTGDGNGMLVAGLSAAALLALGVIAAYAVRRRKDS